MSKKSVIEKLAILADAAKYDASCASSGTERRSSLGKAGIGSTEGMGICHSYTPDGRCISLLKVLLTNFCIFDCRYCINRASSNVERARFSVDEVVDLTLRFYKRNYIEGLFLSSGIIRSADYTMEQLVEVARRLRVDHGFAGYIHLKTIAECDPGLIDLAGQFADRLSVNIELPTQESLARYAPEKTVESITRAMGAVQHRIEDARDARTSRLIGKAKPPSFAPGGQSTQMIVGADHAPDAIILGQSVALYKGYGLRRVYYSAFSPIPDASGDLPPTRPPLMREHRLYQADWMYRFYGFSADEILSGGREGMLDLAIDPKLAWALAHRERFPVDLNTADYEVILRVPGIGPRVAKRILSARRQQQLRLVDLARLCQSVRKISPFIIVADSTPGRLLDVTDLRARFEPEPVQPDLFAA